MSEPSRRREARRPRGCPSTIHAAPLAAETYLVELDAFRQALLILRYLGFFLWIGCCESLVVGCTLIRSHEKHSQL